MATEQTPTATAAAVAAADGGVGSPTEIGRRSVDGRAMGSASARRLWLLVAAVGCLGVLFCAHAVDVHAVLHALVAAAEGWKSSAPAATLAASSMLVSLWILSFVPLTPLELSLGYLFGVFPSYVVVYVGKVVGCSVAFLLGRTVAREWAQEQFGRHELLKAVDLAVSERPFQICVIVRLAYIPIALKNYGLAVLTVKASDYIRSLLAVELVMSFVLVTVGATAKDLGSMLSGKQAKSPWQLAAMGTGCLFLLALVSYVSVFTQKALRTLRERKSAGASKLD